MRRIAEHMANALELGQDLVLVTVVKRMGSTPRDAGSQMLVSAEGLVCGTIGGGVMEARAIEAARAMVGGSYCRTENMLLLHQAQKGLDMPCGGDVVLLYVPVNSDDACWRQVTAELVKCIETRIPATLMLRCGEEERFAGDVALVSQAGQILAGSCSLPLEKRTNVEPHGVADGYFAMPVTLPTRAIVFGGGHVGRATIEALSKVGFACTLFECRPDFAQPENLPAACEVVLGDYEDIASSLAFEPGDFVIIMTYSHQFDYAVLEQALRQPLAYVGFMGSRRKIAAARERMLQAGVLEEAIAAVHMPIGLSIQAETPEEIAVSVAAECIQQRALQQANR